MPQQKEKLTYEKLRGTPEPELIKMIDYHLGGIDLDQTSDLVARILHDELVRRDQNRATNAMMQYTWLITVMTFIVMAATIFGLLK